MPWSDPQPAIQLVNLHDPSPKKALSGVALDRSEVRVTSTASAVENRLGSFTISESCRVFGIADTTMRDALDVPAFPPSAVAAIAARWDPFLTPPVYSGDEAASWKLSSRVQGLLYEVTRRDSSLDIDPSGSGPVATLFSTGVPRMYADAIGMYFETITGVRDKPSGGHVASIGLSSGYFYVVFKDLDVFKVPAEAGGGWMMLAARYRMPRFDASGNVIAYSDGIEAAAIPAESAGDVVAFVAEDLAFSKGVRGPYLVVDSLEAVRGNQPFRLWLGVPSGTFARDPVTGALSLFVYYVIEQNFGTIPSLTLPPIDGSISTSSFDAWRDAADDWAGGTFEMNGRGIAVKRIDARTILDEVVSKGPVSECVWTRACAIPGELLGPVQVMVAVGAIGAGRYAVRPFEVQFDLFGSSPVKVDPDAFTCRGALHLLFCARERDFLVDYYWPKGGTPVVNGHNGHGVWHCAAVDPGVLLVDADTGRSEAAVFDRHFVVHPGRSLTPYAPWSRWSWPDLLVASDVTSDNAWAFQDPDLIPLPGGGFAVLAGASRMTWYDTGQARGWRGGPLVRIDGEESDLCWRWDEAFAKAVAPGEPRHALWPDTEPELPDWKVLADDPRRFDWPV